MGAKAARGILSALFVALLFTVVSCGDDKQDSPAAPPVITGVGTGTGTGTGTGSGTGTGGSCQGANYAANVEVYYNGAVSSDFPNANVSYIGTIVSTVYLSGNWYAQASFSHFSGTRFVLLTDLSTIATCSPSLLNRAAYYTGASKTNFPLGTPGGVPQYQGLVKRVYTGYSGGFVEVDWNHLTPNVVVPFNDLVLGN